MFRALPEDAHRSGSKLLRAGSFKELKIKQNYEEVAAVINEQKFESGDVLGITWFAFRHCLEYMLGGAWLTGYKLAASRNRFIYSSETRARLQKALQSLHQYTQRTQLTRTGAIGIEPPDGLFGFVAKQLWEPQ